MSSRMRSTQSRPNAPLSATIPSRWRTSRSASTSIRDSSEAASVIVFLISPSANPIAQPHDKDKGSGRAAGDAATCFPGAAMSSDTAKEPLRRGQNPDWPSVEKRHRVLEAAGIEIGPRLRDAIPQMRREHGIPQSTQWMVFWQRLFVVHVER